MFSTCIYTSIINGKSMVFIVHITFKYSSIVVILYIVLCLEFLKIISKSFAFLVLYVKHLVTLWLYMQVGDEPLTGWRINLLIVFIILFLVQLAYIPCQLVLFIYCLGFMSVSTLYRSYQDG